MIIDKFDESTSEKKFRNPEPGSYVARLFSIIDIGHQQTTWNGNTKIQHKILFNWELFGEDSNGPLEIQGKPLTVFKKYTLSNHPESSLMADLKAWGGKEVPLPLDLNSVLGSYALVNIVHNEYQGKTYANIANMVQLPKMMQGSVPAGVNEAFIYETIKHPLNFDKVWPWQQKMIAESSEYRGTAAAKQAQTSNDMPDDIPF